MSEFSVDVSGEKSNFIGGFFQRERTDNKTISSIFNHWVGNCAYFDFRNARSALFAYLSSIDFSDLWLPAYGCHTLDVGLPFKTYPLKDGTFEPDLGFFRKTLKSSDAVLAIDYWGQSQSSEFLQYVAENPQIRWIQDCSQSLKPETYWGAVQIFSPRKILGVPGGGLLIDRSDDNFHFARRRKMKLFGFPLTPDLLRAFDKSEKYLHVWYRINSFREARQSVTWQSGPRKSLSILKQLDIVNLSNKRKENFRYLSENIDEGLEVLKKNVDEFTPFGFPILVYNRDQLVQHLISRNIYPAIHWKNILDNTKEYESGISQKIVTLPIDHRYQLHDMQRIVEAVNGFNLKENKRELS